MYLVLAQLWKYAENVNPLNNHFGTLESKSGLNGTWIWAGKHWDKKDLIKRGLPDVIVTVTSNSENSQAIILDGDGEDGEFVKDQQCKKATRVWIVNSFSAQRWKIDGSTLKNKEGLWKSVDSWTFKVKDSTEDDGLIYIENTSKAKVLEATSDGKVIQEELVEDKAHQLWRKGTPDGHDSEFVKKTM